MRKSQTIDYSRYLPAIMHEDNPFLADYLKIMATILHGGEDQAPVADDDVMLTGIGPSLDELHDKLGRAYPLMPPQKNVPQKLLEHRFACDEDQFLSWLSRWLDLDFVATLDLTQEQKKYILLQCLRISRLRGTWEGLQSIVDLHNQLYGSKIEVFKEENPPNLFIVGKARVGYTPLGKAIDYLRITYAVTSQEQQIETLNSESISIGFNNGHIVKVSKTNSEWILNDKAIKCYNNWKKERKPVKNIPIQDVGTKPFYYQLYQPDEKEIAILFINKNQLVCRRAENFNLELLDELEDWILPAFVKKKSESESKSNLYIYKE